MKKLMFAAAAIAASAAMAIESDNIVGYATQGLLNNDMTMYGMQFEKVDGTPITLADLQGDFFGGPSQGEADTISLWLDDGYHYYFYGYWDDPEWDYKWYNSSEVDCSNVEIPVGRACWYIRRANTATVLNFTSPIAK